jgi:membrane-associated HD superfamily phosphohydrolase
MVRDRSRRAIIATVSTVLWVGYMVVGLALINALAPTVGGEGPEGTAAFIGLVWGVVTAGLIQWAVSD